MALVSLWLTISGFPVLVYCISTLKGLLAPDSIVFGQLTADEGLDSVLQSNVSIANAGSRERFVALCTLETGSIFVWMNRVLMLNEISSAGETLGATVAGKLSWVFAESLRLGHLGRDQVVVGKLERRVWVKSLGK